MAKHGALLVIGSGPGVGAHVAACFAQHGFPRVVLMSRNLRRLQDDAMIVRSVAGNTVVSVVQIDMTNTLQIGSILDDVEASLQGMPIECVFFNTARAQTSGFLETPVHDLRQNLDIAVVSLYAVIHWCMPRLLRIARVDENKPTLVVTSGTFNHAPVPPWFSLATCRAAQMHLLESCAQEYGPQGIHCALVSIHDGTSLLCNAPGVAQKAWQLFSDTHGHSDLTVPTVIEVSESA